MLCHKKANGIQLMANNHLKSDPAIWGLNLQLHKLDKWPLDFQAPAENFVINKTK